MNDPGEVCVLGLVLGISLITVLVHHSMIPTCRLFPGKFQDHVFSPNLILAKNLKNQK
jgi:hypothetical protein